jgi:hypothetical protein
MEKKEEITSKKGQVVIPDADERHHMSGETDVFEMSRQCIANESTHTNPGKRAETAAGSWKCRHGPTSKPIRVF